MLNEIVPLSLPGRGLASVVLPAFAVCYAVTPVEGSDGDVRVEVALKTPSDATFMAAVRRARKEYPRNWVLTSSANNGGGDFGAADKYWSAIVTREVNGAVKLKTTTTGDPIADAYRTFADRAAVSGRGLSELANMLERMDDADTGEPDAGFSLGLEKD